jgi:hypothetical protein
MRNKKRGPLARLLYRARIAFWCWRIDRQIEKTFDTPEKRGAAQVIREKIAASIGVPVEILRIAKKDENARPGGVYIPYGPSSFVSGRELDHYAWEWIGINRKPGETDEELRLRCIDILKKTYEGTLVVPGDDLRDYLEAAISKEKQGVIRNE